MDKSFVVISIDLRIKIKLNKIILYGKIKKLNFIINKNYYKNIKNK